jgi:hypothetical protein
MMNDVWNDGDVAHQGALSVIKTTRWELKSR